MSQASLAGKKYPSIPWRQFLIPLSANNHTAKRNLQMKTDADAFAATGLTSPFFPYPLTASCPAGTMPFIHGDKTDIVLWTAGQLPILLIILIPVTLVIARFFASPFPFSLFLRHHESPRPHWPFSRNGSHPSGRDIESVDEKSIRRHSSPRLSPLLLLHLVQACTGLVATVAGVLLLMKQGVVNYIDGSPCTGHISIPTTNLADPQAVQFSSPPEYDQFVSPLFRIQLHNAYIISMLCMLLLSGVANGILWADVLIDLIAYVRAAMGGSASRRNREPGCTKSCDKNII